VDTINKKRYNRSNKTYLQSRNSENKKRKNRRVGQKSINYSNSNDNDQLKSNYKTRSRTSCEKLFNENLGFNSNDEELNKQTDSDRDTVSNKKGLY